MRREKVAIVRFKNRWVLAAVSLMGLAACGSGTGTKDSGIAATGGGTAATGGGGGTTGGGGGATIDAGPSTSADGGSRFRFWDGGACTVETDCPCFSSDDCGPGFYCHSKDPTGVNVFCIPGARGSGLAGGACAGEADCASALCTDSSSAGKQCSALCDVPAECPVTLPRCTYIGFGVDRSICAP